MRTRYRFALLAVLALLVPASALAQTPPPNYDLYWVDTNSDQVWAYVDTAGTIVNPTPMFSGVTSMAVAQDGGVLIGKQLGIDRLDPVTGTTTTLDPYSYNIGELCEDGESGDIFWISGTGYSELWVLPSGTSTSLMATTFTDQPLDIDVIPNGERAGNLLILLDSYGVDPRLVELERDGLNEFTIVDTVATFYEQCPLAFSFLPNGHIIVLDCVDGMWEVEYDGSMTQFGTFSDDGVTDISVGADGTVYVMGEAYASVFRFNSFGQQLFPSIFGPLLGGPIEAVGFVPTPPGSNVVVNPLLGVDVLFEEITDGGYTSAETTESDSRTSPGGNDLPAYAQPPGSRSDFTYIAATTSAVYENLIQVDVYLPGSRFFVAQGTGGEFHDVTVVGSIEDARGVISRFNSPVQIPTGDGTRIDGPTEFVLVEDTRALPDVVDAKFDRLIDLLNDGEHSPSATMDLVYASRYLLRRAMTAERIYDGGSVLGAIAELAMMNDDIRSFAGKGVPNSSEDPLGNVAGEMLSRSKTLMFSLGLMVTPLRGAGVEADGATLALATPNPVRGECRMQLTGPAGTRALAAIYTVGGRLVRTLYEGELATGSQELVWNGTDDAGRRVASGVYLTRAIAGSRVSTGKLVYVR